jgi:hypothetical protein
MSSDDYYRSQAADAQKQAARSINEVDRVSWLRIAQSWLGLINRRPDRTTTEETFKAATNAQCSIVSYGCRTDMADCVFR